MGNSGTKAERGVDDAGRPEMMTPSGAGLEGLVIVGSGGFGREVLQLVRDINSAKPTFDLLGFLDDHPADEAMIERLGFRVLGTSAIVAELTASVVIAIAAPAARRRIDEQARAFGLSAARLVHPWSSVGVSVTLDEGVIIGAGSRLTSSVVVGRHTHVNVNCSVGHDAVLESYVTVFPGVHVSGGCLVEEGATLGTGCILLPGVCVGRDAEVGAGAVVVRDVAPGAIVVAPVGRPTLRAAANEGWRNPHDVSKAE